MDQVYEFQVIRDLLLDGVELTYGKLTLCDLTKYSAFRGTRRYQVFCDDNKIRDEKGRTGYYKVFQTQDIDKAVSKFLEIKQQLNSRIRFHVKRREYE